MRKTLTIILVVLFCVLGCSSLFILSRNNDDISTPLTPSTPTTNTQNIDWSNITISCFGDSLTAGFKIDRAYPSVLKEQLGVKNSINYGISGSTVGYFANYTYEPFYTRYNKISSTSDIIIVMGGYNDFKYVPELGTIDDYGSTTLYGAWNIICKGLKEKYPNSFIFFMNNFKYDYIEDTNVNGYSYKDYLYTATNEVCKKYDIPVFDTYNELDFVTSRDTFDGCHPTQDYVDNVFTPALAQFIKNNYKK